MSTKNHKGMQFGRKVLWQSLLGCFRIQIIDRIAYNLLFSENAGLRPSVGTHLLRDRFHTSAETRMVIQAAVHKVRNQGRRISSGRAHAFNIMEGQDKNDLS